MQPNTTPSTGAAEAAADPAGATRRSLALPDGRKVAFHSLPALAELGFPGIARMPVSLRIVLESALRNCGGAAITAAQVRDLASWQAQAPRTTEISFVPGRVLLQDFTGIPLLADLAAMRSVASRLGHDPALIEPLVPVHFVVDHSVQLDYTNVPNALRLNMEKEFERNGERYAFMKWGMQAFDTLKVLPPGTGICHQINLEHLAQGVLVQNGLAYPDTLIGTDSHTTMANGIGVVGWGAGGIEAEAAMLGLPVQFLMPDVIGVELTGALPAGSNATDLVLTVTEQLRTLGVVGKFVEFHGPGAASLSGADRATVGNMAPEYGATMGYFPVDERTLDYYRGTGRSEEQIALIRAYFEAQGLFGTPAIGALDYTATLRIDLSAIAPSVSGPRRPQDRIALPAVKDCFAALLAAPKAEGGYGKQGAAAAPVRIADGDVLIASITSCTNTSNPSVLLAAGLLAKKAVERGMTVSPAIKTSFGPGSRVVPEYLAKVGLLPYLEKLGFGVSAFGCTACVGNVGPMAPAIEAEIVENDLVCAAVLSGNRNFEARIHPQVRANFLMSPPLVVAYALAGTMLRDLTTEPVGLAADKTPVHLADLWPSEEEIAQALRDAASPEAFHRLYGDLTRGHDLWNAVPTATGRVYPWPKSTYIAEPPLFDGFGPEPAPFRPIQGARALAIFGNSITTDHISPAGSIKKGSPAARWLESRGVPPAEYNTYGTRRGHHDVLIPGTFANVRIKNLMLPGVEGGDTLHQPDGARMSIFDAAMAYANERVPLLVFAGSEYGNGSSRDWAAKGTALLGVRAVVAKSFERIHRSNLVGMGVLPLQFPDGVDAATLGLDGTEIFDFPGLATGIGTAQQTPLVIRRVDGSTEAVELLVRIDTDAEAEYFRHGGILPFVLRRLLSGSSDLAAAG